MMVIPTGLTSMRNSRSGTSRRIRQWYVTGYFGRTSTVPPSTSGPSERPQRTLWPHADQVDGSMYSAQIAAGSIGASRVASIV